MKSDSPFDRAVNRIAGFFGGGIAGIAIGIIGVVIAVKFGAIPLDLAFYAVLGSIIMFAVVGAIWPKRFAWVLDVLSFW